MKLSKILALVMALVMVFAFAAVKQAIEENPKAVNDYLEGQKASLNFLVGQVMRLTRGKADPGETVKMLKEEIEG